MSEPLEPYIPDSGDAIFIYGHAFSEWDGEFYMADHQDDKEYPRFYIEGKRFREGNISVEHARALYEWLGSRLNEGDAS